MIVIYFNALEGCSGSNAVDKDECIDFADPLFSQSSIIAATRVDNFHKTRLTTYNNLLSVRIFDGGFVLQQKLSLIKRLNINVAKVEISLLSHKNVSTRILDIKLSSQLLRLP